MEYIPLKRQTTDLFVRILFSLLYLKALKFRWFPEGGRRYSYYLRGKNKIESPTPYFRLLEILQLENIFKLKIASLVHKMQYQKNKKLPALNDLVQPASSVHNYKLPGMPLIKTCR